MVLEIALGIVALITTKSIVSNIKHNKRVTKEIMKKERRKLLWRYGPFKIDTEIADQLLRDNPNMLKVPNDQVKKPDRAA
jgi:hypothetical protein